MFLDMTFQECSQAAPVGRVMTTTFSELEIGQKCRVMLAGKMEIVEKTEWVKSGSRAFNARKLTGRHGRTFVYTDRIVEEADHDN